MREGKISFVPQDPAPDGTQKTFPSRKHLIIKMTSRHQLKNFWYDKGIRITIYGIVVLIPLVFSPIFQSVFSLPKLIILHSLCLLILLLWGYKSLQEEKFSYYKSPLNICLFAYALISILTTVFSINFFTSFWGAYGRFVGLWTTLDLLLLTFCTATFFRNATDQSPDSRKKKIAMLLIASVITSTLVSLYSLMEYAGFLKEIFHWNQDPAERLFGTLGHGNHLGAYVGMNIILGSGLFFIFKKKSHQLLLTISLILQLSVLILTGSRGAFLALFITALFLLSLAVYRQRQGFRKLLRSKWPILTGLLAVIIIIPIIFWPAIQQTALFQRTMETFDTWEEGSIPDRLSWWKSSLEMVKDRPLLGFGLATFRDIYNHYRRTDYKVPGPGHIQDLTTPETAHNEYVNIAATQGLLGLTAFLAIIITVIHNLVRQFSHKSTPSLLAFSTLGAIVFFLLQLIVNFGVVSTLPLFFILLAFGEIQKKSPQRILSYKGWSKYFFSVVSLVIVSVAFVTVWHQAAADFFLKEAYRAHAEGQSEKVLESCQKAVIHHSYEYLYFQNCADIMVKMSHELKNGYSFLRIAEDFYRKAMALNNYHPSTFFNLGAIQLQLAQEPMAWANFQTAMDLAINNPLYSYQTAQLYLKLSTSDAQRKAKEALTKTVQIQPDYKDAQKLLQTLSSS